LSATRRRAFMHVRRDLGEDEMNQDIRLPWVREMSMKSSFALCAKGRAKVDPLANGSLVLLGCDTKCDTRTAGLIVGVLI